MIPNQPMEGNTSQVFSKAIADGDLDTTVQLLDSGVININDHDITHDLQTPLMRLCHADFRQPEAFKVIVETLKDDEILDLNQQDAVGRTLAMHACIAHNVTMLEFVIGHHCDIKICDRQGKNLIHYAASTGSDAIVEVALRHPEAGHALRTLDYQGYSPLDLAKQRKYTSVARMLTSFLQSSKPSMSTKTETPSHQATCRDDHVQFPTHSKLDIHPPGNEVHHSEYEQPEDQPAAKLKPLGPLIRHDNQNHFIPSQKFRHPVSPRKMTNQLAAEKDFPLTSPRALQPLPVNHGHLHNENTDTAQAMASLHSKPSTLDVSLKDDLHNEGYRLSSKNPLPGTGTRDISNGTHPVHHRKPETGVPLPPCIGRNSKSPTKRPPPWVHQSGLSKGGDSTSKQPVLSHQDGSTAHTDDLSGDQSSGIDTPGHKSPIADLKSIGRNPLHKSRHQLSPMVDLQDMSIPLDGLPLRGGLEKSLNDSSGEAKLKPSLELNSLLSPRPRPRFNHNHALLQKRHDRDVEDDVMETIHSARAKTARDRSGGFAETHHVKSQQPHQINLNYNSVHHTDTAASQHDQNGNSRLRHRRSSLSLPDLRDMTGCLVTKHEASMLQELNKSSDKKHSAVSRKTYSKGALRHVAQNDDESENDKDDNAEIEGDSESSADSCFDDESANSSVGHGNFKSAKIQEKSFPTIRFQSPERD